MHSSKSLVRILCSHKQYFMNAGKVFKFRVFAFSSPAACRYVSGITVVYIISDKSWIPFVVDVFLDRIFACASAGVNSDFVEVVLSLKNNGPSLLSTRDMLKLITRHMQYKLRSYKFPRIYCYRYLFLRSRQFRFCRGGIVLKKQWTKFAIYTRHVENSLHGISSIIWGLTNFQGFICYRYLFLRSTRLRS